MKTIKQLLMTVVVLLCSATANAHDFEVDGIYYNIISTENSKVEVTYKGSTYNFYDDEYNGNVVIPSTVSRNGKDYSVTRIGENAFSVCSGLTSVIIPTSVTSIGVRAFYWSRNLTSVTIPNSVTSIGGGAFYGCCSLTSITIPNSVTSIGVSAFESCTGLTSVNIPDNVASIEGRAFYGCSNLVRITIGRSVTNIGSKAFDECSINVVINFSELNFSKNSSEYGRIAANASYVVNDAENYIEGDFVFATTNEENVLCAYLGNATDLILPVNYNGENYAIGNMAFYNCSGLTSVTISSGVTSIGNSAFEGCIGLTEIVIPNSVTSIGYDAFRNCSNLTMVVIPNNIESIGYYVFYDCNNIEEIYSLSRKAISCENLFSNDVYNNAILYVPEGREPAYSKTSPWSNFYIKPIKSFTATYMLDGNEYAKYSVETFSEIPVPETPFKEGYTFKGWDNKPLYMPKNDVTINGSFEVNTYAVTYIVDGDTVAVDSVAYGAEITPIAAPVKEGYTFSGWSEAPATMPANDIVISGSFEINTYVVTYLVDGKTFATDSIVFNGDVNVISAPTKEGYTFSGWSYAPKKMPAEDIVISGTFSANYYTITYLVDGEEYKSEHIAYGTEIKLLDAPVKEGYTFSGWSDAPMTMPAEDITIIGSFVATGISYVSADARIKVNGNSITLSGANNSTVTIYSTSGALVEKIDSYAGEEIILDRGVYIVRVGGKAVKVKL